MRYRSPFFAAIVAIGLAACSTPPSQPSPSTPPASAAAPEPALSIKPEAGKETCAARPAGAHPANPSLCVTMGNFSHDVYQLKLDGRTVLKGIDDQTTAGIAGQHGKQAVELRCLPQNIFPKETPEATLSEVRRQLPNAPEAQVKRLAGLLGPGPMGMEVGRSCTATIAGATVLTAQVLFD